MSLLKKILGKKEKGGCCTFDLDKEIEKAKVEKEEKESEKKED